MVSRPLRSGDYADLRPPAAWPIIDPRFVAVSVLLICACAAGGSSGYYPGRTMIVELAAVAALSTILLTWRGPWPSKSVSVGIVLILGLPLLQLVPLPATVWQALPGRTLAADISSSIDPTMTRPISLDPAATFASWLFMLTAIAMFLGVYQLTQRQREWLAGITLVICLFSVMLGALQMTAGRSYYLYSTTHNQYPIGLFANRNHQAALLYIGIILCAVISRRLVFPIYKIIIFGLAVVFCASLVATSSRSGMALAFLGIMSIFVQQKRYTKANLILSAVIVIVGVIILLEVNVARDAIERFAFNSSDGRFIFWPDVAFAAQQYFPVGSGVGTFVKSYQGYEQLSTLGPEFVNQAHNEYLQVVLEGGLAGALIVFFYIAWLLRQGVLHWKHSTILSRAAFCSIVLVLLHSMVDYPLRTFALSAIFGMLSAMILPPPDDVLLPMRDQLGEDV